MFASYLLAGCIATLAHAAEVKGPVTEEGTLDGAPFLIEVPEKWNGGLIMYAHGYAVVYQTPRYNRLIVDIGKAQGFAVAQSLYSKQGWAAEQGVLETEALRQYFAKKYGETSPTIIAGHSQGASITFETIERFPKEYDGALPMCGTPESTPKFFKERMFDMRILFDYYFPGLPGSAVEFPDGQATMPKMLGRARELVEADPKRAEEFIRLVDLPDVPTLPTVIAFWSEILREMQTRAGGNAFDNRDTIYAGSSNDAELNRNVQRFAGDPKAMEYVKAWVTIDARIEDPVLAVHTLVDQLISARSPKYYETLTELAGTRDKYVQLWVDRVGHCAFSPEETAEALRMLVAWIKDGVKPTPGELKGK
ncbi:MAG: DUF6351 family protein [Candidatus Hydrogenedentota bacterium]